MFIYELSRDRQYPKESVTKKGNAYHECRAGRRSALLFPIVTGFIFDEFSFSKSITDVFLMKHKKTPLKDCLGMNVLGCVVDMLVFYVIGKGIDALITKRRMKKADKLAEQQKINVNV